MDINNDNYDITNEPNCVKQGDVSANCGRFNVRSVADIYFGILEKQDKFILPFISMGVFFLD